MRIFNVFYYYIQGILNDVNYVALVDVMSDFGCCNWLFLLKEKVHFWVYNGLGVEMNKTDTIVPVVRCSFNLLGRK